MSTVPAASTNLTPTMRNSAQSAQWKEFLRQQLFDLRVALPGIIISFSATEQVAIVQPAVREKLTVPGQPFQNVSLPYLYDVPVVMPRGGNFAVTLPVSPGDECLLVFCDMAIDVWWQNGGLQNQYQFESPRHDISDAVAILGPWSQPKVISNLSTDSLQVRSLDGAAIIDVAESGVTVTASEIELTAPTITAANGGASQAVVTDAFYTYWNTHILPFLTSKGYGGPAPPTNSITTVFEAQ